MISLKYIIMADGKGKRWKNFNGLPKHLVPIEGKPMIVRTIEQIRHIDPESEIIITSHNKAYDFPGATRYEPRDNHMEIDRFTEELIDDDICFLYGDTFYTEDCLLKISESDLGKVTFFGNEKSIVAIKIRDGEEFRQHKKKVKELYLDGKIENCIGWQVYQSYAGLVIGNEKKIGDYFIHISRETFDINTPEDYLSTIGEAGK